MNEKSSPDLEPEAFELLKQRMEVALLQRQREQGLGKPILSGELNGLRLVAVGNKLRWGPWKTFPDFLLAYFPIVMGSDWWASEESKHPVSEHPLFEQLRRLRKLQSTAAPGGDGISRAPMTGAANAFFALAYALYCLEHNTEVQARLVRRLRNKEEFADARYEALIAAAFTRAGFAVAFEDEEDGTTTHTEFVATHLVTGKAFTVECKRRNSADTSNMRRVGRLVRRAISKRSLHERIVFVDLNYPDVELEVSDQATLSPWANQALTQIHRLQDKQQVPLNLAHVIITNDPSPILLDRESTRYMILRTSVGLGSRRFGEACTLRELINYRSEAPEVWELCESLFDHASVPAFFDAAPLELDRDPSHLPRLLVGDSYEYEPGKVGVITSVPVVMENQSIAIAPMRTQNGEIALISFQLSKAEIEAWKAHPDTFFGVVSSGSKKLKTPLDYYDFNLRAMTGMSRDALRTVMKGWPASYDLENKSRDELASLLAESRALQMLAVAKG